MKISTKIGQLFQLLIIALALVGSNAWATIQQVNKVYQITSADDLYEFASIVNGTHKTINQNVSANAVLTTNIEIKENLDDNGNLLASPTKSWTPIGTYSTDWFGLTQSKAYKGTFNGNGHTIRGLYINDSNKSYVGLFGYIDGATIDGVNLVDCYFGGDNYVGGICGYNRASDISNCSNSGSVNGIKYVGGISGYNESYLTDAVSVTNVYNTGSVTGNDYVGGICGYNDKSISGTQSDVSASYNTGTVTGTGENVGSICGSSDGSTSDNYYLATTDDGNGGKTAKQFANGEVASLLQNANDNNNWGQSDGDASPSLGGGSSSSSSSTTDPTAKIAKVINCMGDEVYSSTSFNTLDDGHHLWLAWDTIPATCTSKSYRIRFCKYSTGHFQVDSIGDALGHKWEESETTAATCTEDGTRTYVCQNDSSHTNTETISATGHDWTEWETKKSATCSEAGVQTRTCKNDSSHKETAEIAMIDHIFDSNGFCTACDAYEPAEVEKHVYQISNAGNLYWFATLVNNNSDNAKASAILTDDIMVNADLNADNLRAWLPIGTEALPYKGTFDGDGYTISGLYYNGSDNNVGLFGYIQGANIRNVAMTGNSISGGTNVGSICGYNKAGTIVNCYNTSSVSGSSNVGGICGYNEATLETGDVLKGGVYNCYNTGSVSVGESGTNIGGICGEYGNKATANCYSNTADRYAAPKDVDNFKSGEVAILMQMWADKSSYSDLKNWSQTYGADSPIFGDNGIEYVRANTSNNWGTLCLPYVYTYTYDSSTLSLYDVKGVVNNELVLSPADEVTPGKPVVYYYTGTDNLLKVSIDSSAFGTPATLTANNSLLYGVYANTTIKAADVANAYYLKEDKFLKINESFIANPFRAYIKTPATAGAPKAPKSLSLSLANNASNGSEEEAATVTESHIVAIYNISGQQVGKMDRGGVYLVKMSDGSTKKVRITE